MDLYIVNASTLKSNHDIYPMVQAIQRQVFEHLQPAWGLARTLHFVNKGEAAPAGSAQVFAVDNSTDAGALGEHDYKGAPTGFAAIKDDEDDSIPFSSVLSHEVLELIVDPDIIRLMQVGESVLPLECCDAVEGAPYLIDGVSVENFVLPSYYIRNAPPPYDYLGVLVAGAPALAHGGYGYSAKLGPWSQQNAEHARAAKRKPAPTWSRRGRREACSK